MSETPGIYGAAVAPLPQRPRRAVSYYVAWVLVSLFGFSLLVIWGLFGALVVQSAATAGGVRETVVAGEGKEKIALLSLNGVIAMPQDGGLLSGKDPVATLLDGIERAAADPDVKGILLEINSPGGGITASDILHERLRRLREEEGKKVVVLMQDLAASGGYYIAAGADSVLAHPTTLTGSIGVITMSIHAEELLAKIGVGVDVIKSGELKDMLSTFREMTEEERVVLQGMIDVMYDRFLDVVMAGRADETLPDGSPFTREHLERIADGRIYTAEQAVAYGLIDGTGYRAEAFAEAKRLAGLTEARLVRYEPAGGLLQLLEARAERPAPSLSVGMLLELRTPSLLYLWTGP